MQASLEVCERYQKQSYRNRCYILAGDGVQMLQVPVVHKADMSIREVLVDYSTPWVVRTGRALDTAYENAAFYEYYRDGLWEILDSRPERLWDLNIGLIRWCLDRLHLPCALEPTAAFTAPDTAAYQVFRDRMGGFTPGLSILDLLFNEGPDAVDFLCP